MGEKKRCPEGLGAREEQRTEPAGGARAPRCKWAGSLLKDWGGREMEGRDPDTERERQRGREPQGPEGSDRGPERLNIATETMHKGRK